METIYQFSATDVAGNTISLEDYRGKALIIVNVASKCGLTPQYEELEQLYQAYHEQGLEIIGFPCNQFKGQEPGTNEEIQAFCKLNYGVTFKIFAKINVNGKDADPLYKYLTNNENGFGGKITWNFEKFLINQDGIIVERVAPKTKPLTMKPAIENLLQK